MFDNQTLLLLTALLFLLLPALVWWGTYGARSEAVRWWCFGSALAGTGILLIGFRPWLPVWATYHLANTCMVMSLIFWAQSLRMSLARPWTRLQILAWAVGVLLFYTYIFEAVDANLRGMLVRVALGVLALNTAVLAATLARRLRSHNAAAIALTYFLLGFVLLLQSVLLAGGSYNPSPFSNTWDASILATVTLATSAVGHFCYAGMILDQNIQAQMQAVQAKLATEETAGLDDQLLSLDRQRRMVMLTGSLAHELDQPLTAAMTQIQVAQRHLQKDPVDGVKVTELLNKTIESVLRAGKILDRIRSTEQSQAMKIQRFDLRAALKAAIELLDAEWRRKRVEVNLQVDDQPLWFDGDEVSVVQVLANLLRNATQAVKSRSARRLDIACLASPEGVQVRVRDSGPGLSSAVLEKWGEAFLSTNRQGLGLGLAISRDIVKQHKGKLELANHPDGGAEAVLTLPFANDAGGTA